LLWLNTNAISELSYTLEVTNETIANQVLNYSGRNNITIILRGTESEQIISIFDNGSIFTIESGVTLILEKNITLEGHNSNNASLVRVNSGGTLIMNNGSKISSNAFRSSVSSSYGGGVYVNNGNFTMNGGEITDNIVSSSVSFGNGGGVYVNNGVFVINGGEIYGNIASHHGGGVYINNSSTFTLSGGKIIANTTSGDGGGLYISNGIFSMNSGEISRNTTYGNGGGVYFAGNTFNMTGGKINGNIAIGSGGGVRVYGVFNMINGEISNNTASVFGGGVHISTTLGSIIKTGGIIYGSNGGIFANTARNSTSGNAVYIDSNRRRESTSELIDNLDSSKSGVEGGWEN